MKRNLSLDLLKILACFSVVVLHVTGRNVQVENDYNISHFLYYLACIAVPVFFMVNGYLMLNKKKITYSYIFSKITNILIIVFSWNFLIMLVKIVLKGELTNPFIETLESFIQRGYFSQFWFFGALIIIYLSLPVINKYFNNKHYAIYLTCVSIGICLLIDFISLIRSMQGYTIVQINVIQTFRLWTWFAYYLLGGLLGKAEIKTNILKIINVKVNFVILVLSLLLSNIYQYNISKIYKLFYAEYFYDNIITFIYVISLFILLLRTNFKNKDREILFIGSNIIGIYILHTTIITVISKVVRLDNVVVNTLSILIVFILSLTASSILSKIPFFKKIISI
jgi:surface polysaccharide O-acyltransferase-like enzyme